jgi:hypothetical protein
MPLIDEDRRGFDVFKFGEYNSKNITINYFPLDTKNINSISVNIGEAGDYNKIYLKEIYRKYLVDDAIVGNDEVILRIKTGYFLLQKVDRGEKITLWILGSGYIKLDGPVPKSVYQK